MQDIKNALSLKYGPCKLYHNGMGCHNYQEFIPRIHEWNIFENIFYSFWYNDGIICFVIRRSLQLELKLYELNIPKSQVMQLLLKTSNAPNIGLKKENN